MPHESSNGGQLSTESTEIPFPFIYLYFFHKERTSKALGWGGGGGGADAPVAPPGYGPGDKAPRF